MKKLLSILRQCGAICLRCGKVCLETLRSHGGRITIRVLAAMLFLALYVYVYILYLGVPHFVCSMIMERISAHIGTVNCRRIRIDKQRGTVLVDNLRYYGLQPDRHRLFEVAGLDLEVDWFEGLLPGFHPRRLKLRHGTLCLRTHAEDQPDPTLDICRIKDIDLDMEIRDGGFRVNKLDLRLYGLRVSGSGFVVSDPEKPPPPMHTRMLLDLLPENSRLLQCLDKVLRQARFDDDAEARLLFFIDPGRPQDTACRIELDAGPMYYRGLSFHSVHMNMRYDDGEFVLERLEARTDRHRVELKARANLDNRTLEASLYNSFPFPCLLAVLPDAWTQKLDRWRLFFDGNCEFQCLIGPAPLDQVFESSAGWIRASDISFRGIPMNKLEATFLYKDASLRFRDLKVDLGTADNPGAIRGSLDYDFKTRRVELNGEGRFNPAILLPIFNKKAAPHFASFAFQKSPPLFKGYYVDRFVDEPNTMQIKGELTAEHAFYKGAYVKAAFMHLSYSNKVLNFAPCILERDDGRGEGSVSIDFEKDLVHVKAQSTLPPKVIGRLIGKHAEEFLRHFHFDGPSRSRVEGRVDYGTYALTRLNAQFEGQRAGVHWCITDWLAFDLNMKGRHIVVTNIKSRVYGGSVEAHALLQLYDKNNRTRYTVDGRVQGADLTQVIAHLFQEDGSKYTGKLSGDIHLNGFMGNDLPATAQGRAKVEIKDGQLFRVPLLGGLSQHMTSIYSGFGYASQTDCEAELDIDNGKLRFSKIHISGDVISAKAKGTYDLSDRLDFRVQVQLLRKGAMADVLRLLTFPVTKLLEFRLKGSLDNPEWEFENLPGK